MHGLAWKRGARKKKDALVPAEEPDLAGNESSSSDGGAAGAVLAHRAAAGGVDGWDMKGLHNWETIRAEWTAEPLPASAATQATGPRRMFRSRREADVEDAIYDELSRPRDRPLPKGTGLADVVRILPAVWEKVSAPPPHRCPRVARCGLCDVR